MSILIIIGIILVSILVIVYTWCRIRCFIRWFLLLRDYQKLSDRLDDDIRLLRDGKFEEAILREAKSDKMIWDFKRKYPKE